MSKGRCGKHKLEHKRSETEMVRPCGEKHCSNEYMEDGNWWTPKVRKTESEVERCYTKRHEGELRSTERRSTRPENVEIENSMRRPQIGKRLKKMLNVSGQTPAYFLK